MVIVAFIAAKLVVVPLSTIEVVAYVVEALRIFMNAVPVALNEPMVATLVSEVEAKTLAVFEVDAKEVSAKILPVALRVPKVALFISELDAFNCPFTFVPARVVVPLAVSETS